MPPTTPHSAANTGADAPLDRSVEAAGELARRLEDSMRRVVVGQRDMIRGLLIGLLTGGHVLLEGVPGLAKTLTVNALARGIHGQFSRIQFTPDLLPADVIGTLIYSPKDGTFSPRKGPVFANIVLADEINRAPAKVQSALLEAMQEKRATIGDKTYDIPKPFLVLATQNPIEQEGTYPLPEAQVDRFMLKLRIGYPTKDDERAIIERMASTAPPPVAEPVADLDQVAAARAAVDKVRCDGRLLDYIVDLVHATRHPDQIRSGKLDLPRLIQYGVSPRAGISLVLAAKSTALLEGRGFVTPSDIKVVAPDVLRHRILPTYEAEAEGVDADRIVREILDRVALP
jgi:MoxR-like ATPase